MERITPAQLIWVMVVNGGHCTRKIPKEWGVGGWEDRQRRRGRITEEIGILVKREQRGWLCVIIWLFSSGNTADSWQWHNGCDNRSVSDWQISVTLSLFNLSQPKQKYSNQKLITRLFNLFFFFNFFLLSVNYVEKSSVVPLFLGRNQLSEP